jgi:hypothetical protein
MANILWKKSTKNMFVLILIVAGIFTLPGVSIANLVRAQSNNPGNLVETQTLGPDSVLQEQEPLQPDQEHGQQQQQEQQHSNDQESQNTASPNHIPKANAGPDKKVREGATVILDAHRSSDPDSGDKIAYSWTQISGPQISLGVSSDDKIASFIAPRVVRDTVLTYALTVTDENGAQDRDIINVSVENIDGDTAKSNNNVLGNTTANTLITLQNGLRNTNTNTNTNTNNNALRINQTQPPTQITISTPTQNTQLSKSTVFTPQALSSSVVSVLSNNFVNTNAVYDIIFRTSTTATIGKMEITFPAGTNLANRRILEVSGLGTGGNTLSGQTVSYNVQSPVSVPSGVYIRMEFWNIVNPGTPGTAFTVQITTKDPSGATIDTGTSLTYAIKQIGTGDIADNSITGAKIQDGQVGTSDIAGNAITGAKILNGTITSGDIAPGTFSGGVADNSITSAKIVDGEVKTADLADNSVTSPKILDGTIGTADIANSAITNAKIAPDSVGTNKIIDGQVGTLDLANTAVTSPKLAQDSVNSTCGPGQNAGSIVCTSKLADNSVVTFCDIPNPCRSKIADNAVTSSKIIDGAISTFKIAGGAVTTDRIANDAITSSKIGTDAVTADEISGVNKLIFSSCNADMSTIAAGDAGAFSCSVSGTSINDNVLTTSGLSSTCLVISISYVVTTDVVQTFVRNVCNFDVDPPATKYSIMVFHT